MENIKEVFNVENGVKEVTIIHKKGLDETAPLRIDINGTIDAPKLFIEKRFTAANKMQDEAMVIVNKEEKSIALILNQTDALNIGIITGQLVTAPELLKWKINSDQDEKWDPIQLAGHIKMNRAYVPGGTWLELFKNLMDVKVEVAKKIEASDDNRGSIKVSLAQEVINNNIPDKFQLNIPIFKGEGRVSFEVEVYMDPSLLRVSLHSPELEEIIINETEARIKKEVEEIKKLSSKLVIINR